MKNYVKLVIGLISVGFTMNTTGQEDVNTEFLEWVEEGDLEEVKNYLAKGADINAKGEEDHGAAWYAIENYNDDGGKELWDYLVSKGLALNAVDEYGHTLMHIAAENNLPELIGLFKEKGVNVNASDTNGETALHFAAYDNNNAAIEKLLALGADASLVDSEGQLFIANYDMEEEGAWEFITSLKLPQAIWCELLVDVVSDDEDLEKTKLLIEKGITMEYLNNNYPDIIVDAVQIEDPAILDYLLSKGANVNLNTEDGENLLWEVYSTAALEVLIKHGIDVNHKNDEGYTALYDFIKFVDLEGLKVLVAAGADITTAMSLGTPLTYAKTLTSSPYSYGYSDPEAGKKALQEYLAKVEEIKAYLKSVGAK